MPRPARFRYRRHSTGMVVGVVVMLLSLTPCQGRAQERSFPYDLGSRDKVIAPTGLAVTALGLYLVSQDDPITLEQITALDRENVNGFDRGATYNWSPDWDTFADWSKNTLLAASVLVPGTSLVLDGEWSDGLTLGAMFLETLSLHMGVTATAKALAGRTRPYAYNTAFTPEERYAIAGPDDASVNRSFFSGHTSMAFAAATFLSTVYGDVHGPTTTSKVIWASSLSLAALTAVARVEAGMHFPTDVITGAVVGSAIGYLIPRLHRVGADHGVSISAGPGSVGIRLAVGGRADVPSR